MKVCNRCDKEKGLDEFYSQKRTKKDGATVVQYQPYCKECAKLKSTKWKEENQDSRNIITRRYNAKKETKIKHRKEEQVARDKGRFREWQRNNKDKLMIYAESRSNKTHEISDTERINCKQYFNFECAYCGLHEDIHKETQGQQLHMDHVDCSGANDLSNNIPACRPCNSSKGDKLFEDWYSEDNVDYTKERLDKIIEWLNGDYLKVMEKSL
jgi:5-methylcytosine-specific restriction endonuclease McrA